MKLNRRTFVAGLGAAAVAAGGLGGAMVSSFRRRHRPNVILFITDDMRYDAAGFAGNPIVQTPHLDRLASEGFVFDTNFVTTSVCPVSRASIMSGDYALRHGVYDFNTPMRKPSFTHSFPVLMQQSGYHTGFIGKWGMGGAQPSGNFNQWYGFLGQGDYYPMKDVHMTDLQTGQSLRFLKTCPKDRPFLLIVAYKAPHGPVIPQPRYAGLYTSDVIPRAKTDNAVAADALPPVIKNSMERRNYFNSDFADESHYQEKMKNYYRLITGIDDSVGAILEQLKQDNRLDDTHILFTSDNGLLEGDHGLEGKWCMYEESIRVPLLIRLAPHYAAAKPARIAAMSLNIDISPTILEMASVEAPPHIQGMSLLPLALAPDAPWREGFYYEHPGWRQMGILACEGFRGLEWKYVRYRNGREVEECLYNLADDPSELTDLARFPEYDATLDYMRSVMLAEKGAILKA